MENKLRDITAEQSLLGSCLIDPASVKLAIEKLQPKDFSSETHQRIFFYIVSLHRDGQAVDSITITEKARLNGGLDNIGGGVYLLDLINSVPTTANTASYIDIILADSKTRQLDEALAEAGARKTYDEKIEVISRVIRDTAKPDEPPKSLEALLGEDIQTAENFWGDGLLQPESRLFIGGQSKTGKTMFLLNLCLCLAAGKPFLNYPVARPLKVLVFQAELSKKNLQTRLKQMIQETEMARDLFFSTTKNLKINDEKDFQRICNTIETLKPEVICFDPLSCFHSCEENSAKEMRQVLNNLDRLIDTFHVSLIISHHHKKPNEFETKGGLQLRGSITLFDYGDSYLTLNPHDNNTTSLIFTLRNAENPEKHILRMNEKLFFEVLNIEGSSKVDETIVYDIIRGAGGRIAGKELIKRVSEACDCAPKTAKRKLQALDGSIIKSEGKTKDRTWTFFDERFGTFDSGHGPNRCPVPNKDAENCIEQAKTLFNGVIQDNEGCPK